MKHNIRKKMFWILVILLPTLTLLYNVIYPTYTYRYNDYHRNLIIEYKKYNKKVTGEITYYWTKDMIRLHLRTKFTGEEKDNKINIILEDNYFRQGHRIVGIFNKKITLYLKEGTISFMDILLN